MGLGLWPFLAFFYMMPFDNPPGLLPDFDQVLQHLNGLVNEYYNTDKNFTWPLAFSAFGLFDLWTFRPLDFSAFLHDAWRPLDNLPCLWPDFDQVLQDLNRFRDVGSGGLSLNAEVHHQHGGEADGQVLRIHFVARALRRDPRQVVHNVHQAVLQ